MERWMELPWVRAYRDRSIVVVVVVVDCGVVFGLGRRPVVDLGLVVVVDWILHHNNIDLVPMEDVPPLDCCWGDVHS